MPLGAAAVSREQFRHPPRVWWRPGWLLLGAALVSALLAAAQQATPEPQPAPPVLRVDTRLVLVDVVVTGKKGEPLAGLAREEFVLEEDGKPQEIAVFASEGSAATVVAPPLPPNVYSNRPEYHPPRGPLTIVLLDSLNTPRADQVRMREEMVRYLANSFQGGQWAAVLSLTDRLRVLQDFTNNREMLLAAVRGYSPQSSALLGVRESVTSRQTDEEILALRELAQGCDEESKRQIYGYIASLKTFQDSQMAQSDKLRMQLSLAALRAVGNAVVGYPGRKNLIWVSAAFPALYVGREKWSAEDEIRQTAQLLNDARLAVYPVDPRGLVAITNEESYAQLVARMGDAEAQIPSAYPQPQLPSESPRSPQRYLYASQAAMKALAENTGGLAFFNRNDIDSAVAAAASDGASYYTLGYYPKHGKWDGSLRRLKVQLARKGLRLRYRQSYYATPGAGFGAVAVAAGSQQGDEWLGALFDPLPATGLTFRAYVRPPESGSSVPVQFWLGPDSALLGEVGGGERELDLGLAVAAFSPNGLQVKKVVQRVQRRLEPGKDPQAWRRGVVLPTTIDLGPGRYELRLLLRDHRTGRVGRVDVPLTLSAAVAATGQ